jgi:uncharacterized protein (TIGR00730 family)
MSYNYCCKRIRVFLGFAKSLWTTNVRLLWGMWRLSKAPQPAITIFGGSRVAKDSLYAKKAQQLAELLTIEEFSVITGGGPGIMEAANKGAFEAAKKFGAQGIKKKKKDIPISIGISLTAFSKEVLNPYVNERIMMKHFFARKWLLVRYSIGFVVFPGGYGTLDELFEVLTLEQTSRMRRLPVILIGTNYWRPIVYWIKSRGVASGLIPEKDLELIYVTNSVKEAVDVIKKYCKCGKNAELLYTQK